MRIGDAISSSVNRRTVPDRFQKTYTYTNYKTHRKSEYHGNHQKTDQVYQSNRGQIIAQRVLSDGSIQFLFKEDMSSQPKWETKTRMETEFPWILEKYEKKQSLLMQNISDLRKEQDYSINGKRRYENDEGQDMNQLDSQQGRKKQYREEERESEDQDLRRLNGNYADSQEEGDKKEIKKIDLKELFRDIQDSDDDDSHSEEQKKEEVQARIDISQKDQIVQDNNCYQVNEKNSENKNESASIKPLISAIRSSQEICKIASKKIQETVRKRTEENQNGLDILDEFRFVDTESQEEIDIESDDESGEVQKQTDMQISQQQRIRDKHNNSGREIMPNNGGEQKIKEQIVEEQKNNQEEDEDEENSSQYQNKSQEKDIKQTKLTSEQQSLRQNGDFQFGDKVKRIRSCQRKEGILIMEVDWLPRCDGYVPKKSIVPSSVFREYDATTLLDFYESKLSFPAKSKSSNSHQKKH